MRKIITVSIRVAVSFTKMVRCGYAGLYRQCDRNMNTKNMIEEVVKALLTFLEKRSVMLTRRIILSEYGLKANLSYATKFTVRSNDYQLIICFVC